MAVVELHLILALILLSGMQKTYSGVDALLFVQFVSDYERCSI